ncbi:hypothetical protein [Geobacter anodireducens]
MATPNICAECIMYQILKNNGFSPEADFNQHGNDVTINNDTTLIEQKIYFGAFPYTGKVKKSVDGWIQSKSQLYPYDVKSFEDKPGEGNGIGITDDELYCYSRAHSNSLLFIFDRNDIKNHIKSNIKLKKCEPQKCAGFLVSCNLFNDPILPKYITTINQILKAPPADKIMDGGGNYRQGRYFIENGLVRGTCVIYKRSETSNYDNMLLYQGWPPTGNITDIIIAFIKNEPWRRY